VSLISLLCAALLAVVPTPRGGAAKAFMRATGHPHGWPGHRVDHVVPLAIGGCDCEANLQWQTVEESVWKDRWERRVDPKCLILIYGKGKMAR
jgi:hypothetical protein